MVTLYGDQIETMDRLRAAMRHSKSVLLQAPTGFGKTACAVNMLSGAQAKGKRVVFTVPRKELLMQTSDAFDEYGIGHSYIAAGKQFNPYAKAYIGMIDTMARRINSLPPADMVIVDEAHFGATSLDRIIKHYREQCAWIVGLSATPWKLSGEGLGKWFDDMVCAPSVGWLIENKRLSRYRLFAPSKPDLQSISVSGGDYNMTQLAALMERDRVLVGDAVKHYREKAMGRLNLTFSPSVRHAEMIADDFNAAGIPSASIDGTMSTDERRRRVRAFARREILVLTTCDLATFGFDLSMASGLPVTVEVMSDLRPTKSLALQAQKWGRVLRYKTEPAIIFDHAGNAEEHGLPCADREWSLSDRKQGKKGGEKAPPSRQCGACFAIHKPSPSCPECGFVYPIKSREVDEIDGTLDEIDIAAQRLERKKEQGRAQTLDELIALGRARGYQNPARWASVLLAKRMMKHG